MEPILAKIAKIPLAQRLLVLVGVVVVLVCQALERTAHVHLEVLLPAFALGCLLYNPHDPHRPQEHAHEHAYLEPETPWARRLDRTIKLLFMFLVGCALPRVALGAMPWATLVGHVVVLTVLSNLGKCFPAFCYRREASMRQRLALSIAMFPRGEVGAGVLLVALSYGLTGWPMVLSSCSLALNLLLTGVFIAMVTRLIAER